MSLYGALFAGVSALTAQSQAMGMISDNIANVNTVGYKRSEAAFSSMVTAQTRATSYAPGAVRASTLSRIDQQGILQQSSSATDIAISGNGFFVVKNSTSDMQEPFYTRAGQFSEDSQGFLVNPAGKYLMGWPVDQNGNLTVGSGDIASLSPVDVAFLGGITRPTTRAEGALNLDAKQIPYVYPLGTPATQQANFSRPITVYDSLGEAQNVTMKFFKTTSPTATAAGSIDVKEVSDLMNTYPTLASTATYNSGVDILTTLGALAPGMLAGDSFTIRMDNQSQTIALDPTWTATDLANAINSVFSGTPATVTAGPRVSINADTPIELRFGGTQPISETNLNAIGFAFVTQPRDPRTFTIQTGTSAVETVSINEGDGAVDLVARINNLPGINAQFDAKGQIVIASDTLGQNLVIGGVGGGGMQMSVAALANLGLTASTYPPPALPNLLTQLDSTPNPHNWWQVEVTAPDGSILNSGMVNFTGNGNINSQTRPASIELNNVQWGNGSSPQNMVIDINNFTQYSGNYNVVYVNQNGAELGLRTGVSIDRDGFVIARFSNGESAKLYKLPIATFANANGLLAKSGNIYQEGNESGEYNLREAGTGSAGVIESGTLESSNVDMADEFSKMIVTQRAYSAGTKIITTSDQMLEELLRLR